MQRKFIMQFWKWLPVVLTVIGTSQTQASSVVTVPAWTLQSPDNNSVIGVTSNDGVSRQATVTSVGTTPVDYGNAYVRATVELNPSPSIFLTAKPDPANLNFNNAGGFLALAYYFTISGAAGAVPVTINASGGYIGGGLSDFYVFDITNPRPDPTIVSAGFSSGAGDYSWSVNQSFDLQTGTLYEVLMRTLVTVSNNTGSSTAWVDPVFTPDLPGYTLTFSDGVSNIASAVPEPSTWAMMLLGFCGFGLLARRRLSMLAEA